MKYVLEKLENKLLDALNIAHTSVFKRLHKVAFSWNITVKLPNLTYDVWGMLSKQNLSTSLTLLGTRRRIKF